MPVPVGPARPRPARDAEFSYDAEYVQVEPGQWAVVVYALIPKLGCESHVFPHYFGGPPERPCWRVDRHGRTPGGTFLFPSPAAATEILTAGFGRTTGLSTFMGWIEIPVRRPPRWFRAASATPKIDEKG